MHSLGTLGLPGTGGPGRPLWTLFGLFWGSGPGGPRSPLCQARGFLKLGHLKKMVKNWLWGPTFREAPKPILGLPFEHKSIQAASLRLLLAETGIYTTNLYDDTAPICIAILTYFFVEALGSGESGVARQTKPKKGQFMNFSQGHSGTKVQCELCLFSSGKTPEFRQKWAKFI